MTRLTKRIETEIPALRRYALALARDPDRADDLVQDCVERALSRFHLWRRPGNLKSWLFTILHNVYANQERARSRSPAVVGLHGAAEQGVPAEQVNRLEATETLDAFSRLTTEQREVLVLVAVEGLRYSETATLLGVPEGTVVSRVSRARARLRQLLEEPHGTRLRRVK